MAITNPNHIRNPFEMAVEQLTGALADGGHALAATPRPHGTPAALVIRRIGVRDLAVALRQGAGDLFAAREDVLFIALVYPVAGLLLAALVLNHDLLPLIFPLASGFALIGPVAAIGLYEISRRRERGDQVSWIDAFGVLRAPGLMSIFGLGLILLAVLLAWLAAAYGIYAATLGPSPPASISAFVHDVFATPAGVDRESGPDLAVGFLASRALALAIQRRLLPAAARPRRRDRPRGRHLVARGRRQPGNHEPLGPDRRRRPGAGIAPGAVRPDPHRPAVRPRHLAPLPPGGRRGAGPLDGRTGSRHGER